MTGLIIDFGGRTIRLRRTDTDAPDTDTPVTLPNRNLAEDLDLVADRVTALLDGQAPTKVAIALPGAVDTARGVMTGVYGKYEHLIGVDMPDWAARNWGISADGVTVINDGKAALVGNVVDGPAHGFDHAVAMVIGTGIGSAALVDGRLLGGHAGHAGILGGHVTITTEPLRCECGNLGCAEVLGGTASLARAAADAGLTDDASRYGVAELLDDVEAGDSRADQLWTRAVQAWAIAALNLCHAYAPQVLVLSGGPLAVAPRIVPSIRDWLDRHLWPSLPRPAVAVAADPANAVLHGLAAIAHRDPRLPAGVLPDIHEPGA